jgi:hypothetical protein
VLRLNPTGATCCTRPAPKFGRRPVLLYDSTSQLPWLVCNPCTYPHHWLINAMNHPLLLALDIGTSSARAMLFDATAHPVDDYAVQIPISMQTTADGGATFDAVALFDTVVTAIDQLLAQLPSSVGPIAAVVSATFVGNVLGVDADGNPLTPVYTYADTRNAADADQLRRELGTSGMAAAHDRTGTLIHTSYLPARMRWLARIELKSFRSVRYWLSFGEYLLWRLTGQRKASYSIAAWTGLLNRHSLQWDEEWLAQLPVQAEQLSPLVDIDEPLGELQPAWAERWPLLRQSRWIPAIGVITPTVLPSPWAPRAPCVWCWMLDWIGCPTASGSTAWIGGAGCSVARRPRVGISTPGFRRAWICRQKRKWSGCWPRPSLPHMG